LLTANISEILRPREPGIILIITVGTVFRSDDGVGPYIAEKCTSLKRNIVVLNAGERPENIIDRAIEIKPQKTIFIDAADFGGYAGEIRLVPEEAIPDTLISTHTFPLKIISRILAKDTGTDVCFIGVQPKDMGFGEGLSPEVRESAELIIGLLNER
jgi:hydrogenase 3 maturation protease